MPCLPADATVDLCAETGDKRSFKAAKLQMLLGRMLDGVGSS